MDIFTSCFEEVNYYVTFAEQNGQTGQGAKTLSLKMNDYTKANELRRFALGLSFLVWPFNSESASATACFFAVTAAKRLIKTVVESVVERVTHAGKMKPKSKASKASSKKDNNNNNNDTMNLQLFVEAIGKCNAVFLKAFFTSGIAINSRRLIDHCIGSLVTLCCALGNREEFVPRSVPWPAFHESYLQLLDQNPETAWGFIHEFVVSFQEHGSALPNLTGYSSELITFGISKQMQPILNACSDFANNLDKPSTVLGNLFRSVATFLSISASDLLLSHYDKGGRNRRHAQTALETFRNTCRAVITTATGPLLNFFQVLPEALFNYRRALPPETFETILQGLECVRGALNRVSSSGDEHGGDDNSSSRGRESDRRVEQDNIGFTRAVILIIGALAPHSGGGGGDDDSGSAGGGTTTAADSHNARQCACTAMATLTEVLDNVDEEAIKQVLSSRLPSENFGAGGGTGGGNQENVGSWFIRALLTEWLLLRKSDEGFENVVASKTGGDWNVIDREQDVPFRIGSSALKKQQQADGGNNNNDDGGDNDDDDDGEGDIDGDSGDVGGAMLEDGIARSAVRACVLDLLGALSTVLPDQTAQIVFSVCTATLNDAGSQLSSGNAAAHRQNDGARTNDLLAARAEAAFVAMSEIVEETFHVLRSNSEAMSALVDAVFGTATFAAFAERPAVLAASIRCAGMIAVACASAATSKPEDDELEADSRRYLSREDVAVVVRGALQMLRHLLAVGVNSRFKRCQWTALHSLTTYIKTIAISMGEVDDDSDDDDDDNEENQHHRNKNNKQNNKNQQPPSTVIPINERRSVLFPPEYEEALAQILFSQDGSNWSGASANAASSRYVKLIEADAVPVLQLMSRALIASVLRALIQLDEYTAPRLHEQQQQLLERSHHLFTHRFVDPMMTCLRVAWTNCPQSNLMELSMYAQLLQALRTPLAIPSFDAQSDSFFILLERFAAGIRELCINALRFLETGDNKDKKQQTVFNGIPVDGLVAVLIDLISELCDGLALGSARLINLHAITGKKVQTSAKTVNGVHLVNAVSSELVLTNDLMCLAHELATARRGEKRRAAFAILSDYAASCFWWRSMISSESSELVLLPLDDSQQTGAFNLPPPFLEEPNPALHTLRPYFKNVFDLCCREMYNFANLDEQDVTDENSASAGNAVWCLCQWLAAACGPSQQASAVIAHALRSGNKNPNTQVVVDSLPFPPPNLMKLISLLLCASSQSVFRASLRDNCLMASLRLATMIPQLMGPSSSNHPVVKVANASLEEIIDQGFVASATVPLAALVVPRLTNPAERCEALMRIAALGSTPFGENNSEFTAVQAALQHQPVALFALILCVEKKDDPVVIELWRPIVQFLASAGAAPSELTQSRKAKLYSIFGVRFS